MSKQETTTYVLKHNVSGMYAKSYYGELTLTDMISKAKEFDPNDSQSNSGFSKLIQSGNFSILKKTETITIGYTEVSIDELRD